MREITRIPLPSEELSLDEIEIALKALGAFQLELYDKFTVEDNSNKASIETDLKLASMCIKKLHKMYEKAKEKSG